MTSSSRAVVLAIAFAAIGCAASTTRTATSAASVDEIRQQVAANLASDACAWNAGDLDTFVSAYVPDASFVTARGVLHGTAAIRGVYAARFAPGGKRDSLHFENLEVDVLAPGTINAIAYYVLMKGDSVTSRGPTSLVMRWSNGRWRIVHDHSS
jgi:uncharacterized protein (TIGR02246 family)